MNNISTFLSDYGLTGIPTIDAIIITTAIPLFISYGTNIGRELWTFLLIFISTFWQLFYSIIIDKIIKKYVGDKLSTIIIEPDDSLHLFILNNVFVKDIKTDNCGKNAYVYQLLLNAIKNIKHKSSNKSYNYFSKYKRKMESTVKPIVGYDTNGNVKLDYVQKTFGRNDNNHHRSQDNSITKQKKSFMVDNNRLDFIINQSSVIKITVTSKVKTDDIIENNTKATNIFNKFLIDKLCYDELKYCKTNIVLQNKKLNDIISTFITESDYKDIYEVLDTLTVQNDVDGDNINNINDSTINNFDSKIDTSNKDMGINEENTIASTSKHLNSCTIGCTTTIFNKEITNYKKFIKVNGSQEHQILTQERLFEIFGKHLMYCDEYSNNKEAENVIVYKTLKILHINKMYILLCNKYDRNKRYDNPKVYDVLIIVSKKSDPIVAKEIENLMNIVILLTQQVNDIKKINDNNIISYKYDSGKWLNYSLEKRTIDTIYLPNKLLYNILYEFESFLDKRKLYETFQIYYKKGLLFYGPPGTGKTSLVRALAYHFKIPLYIININDKKVNDDNLVDILNTLPGNDEYKIVLYEDIDSAFSDKEVMMIENKSIIVEKEVKPTTNVEEDPYKTVINEIKNNDDTVKGNDAVKANDATKCDDKNNLTKKFSQKFLTYSGLLNALDGVLSNQKGIITIMTTNHIGKLGSALIRPGRIDRAFELTYCNDEQIFNMVKSMITKYYAFLDMTLEKNKMLHIHDRTLELIKKLGTNKIKPSKLQFYILKYLNNLDDIFDNYLELLDDISNQQ